MRATQFLFAMLLALGAFAVLTSAVRIRNCDKKTHVDWDKLQITGCTKTSPRCIFKKGHMASLNVTFEPTTDATELDAKVHGIVSGLPIPFTLDQPKVCSPGNKGGPAKVTPCPIKAGEKAHYSDGVQVLTVYPTMDLSVKWELYDQHKQRQLCMIIPVRIQG